MPSYWKHVNHVLQESDIILEILDARMIEMTRNVEIEEKVQRSGKTLLYVLNKCDLVDKDVMDRAKQILHPCVFVSSTDRLGTTILKKKIMELSHGNAVVVGVVGYPNVGKSSIINSLAGKHAARTSPESGFTHGMQRVRAGAKIVVLDTPGVFPYTEKDEVKHALTGAIDYAKIKDPETAALQLLQSRGKAISKHYGIEHHEDAEELLEALAFRFGKLLKGGKPDTIAAARHLLKDWQRGNLS